MVAVRHRRRGGGPLTRHASICRHCSRLTRVPANWLSVGTPCAGHRRKNAPDHSGACFGSFSLLCLASAEQSAFFLPRLQVSRRNLRACRNSCSIHARAPLFFSHIVTTGEPAPPEMRLRIASPPPPGEATAIFLVRLCLDLSDACIHFATRPLTFYVAALVALFKLKTLCRGGKGSPTTDCCCWTTGRG